MKTLFTMIALMLNFAYADILYMNIKFSNPGIIPDQIKVFLPNQQFTPWLNAFPNGGNKYLYSAGDINLPNIGFYIRVDDQNKYWCQDNRSLHIKGIAANTGMNIILMGNIRFISDGHALSRFKGKYTDINGDIDSFDDQSYCCYVGTDGYCSN